MPSLAALSEVELRRVKAAATRLRSEVFQCINLVRGGEEQGGERGGLRSEVFQCIILVRKKEGEGGGGAAQGSVPVHQPGEEEGGRGPEGEGGGGLRSKVFQCINLVKDGGKKGEGAVFCFELKFIFKPIFKSNVGGAA